MLEETFRERERKIRQQGREEGQQQAYRQGFREGQVKGWQKGLLWVLRDRFGPVPGNVRQRVWAISSLSELRRLLRRILTAKSLRDTGLL